jgi:GT2 family glycosyltransferase
MSDCRTKRAGRSEITAEDGRPLVSVIIPAYNASVYIAAALDSVFQQTFSSYEVIVVNDGSPDTPSLETALQPFLSRLRYFRQENRGPSAARNLGIREARGRYVALLDSDDVWLPHHLACQTNYLTRKSELELVYSDNMQFRKRRALGAAFETVPQTGPVSLDSLLAERCTVNTSSVVVLRDALLKAGLFDENLHRCEDFDLWLRLAAAGVRMTYDPEIQVLHRLGQGLSSNSELMKRARAEVYKKAAATLALNAEQQEIVRVKLKQLEIEIEVEVAKEHLEAGRFREASSALQRADALESAPKLRLAEAGLRLCPVLMRWFYKRYIQLLRWYKLRGVVSAPRGVCLASELDMPLRQRPVR